MNFHMEELNNTNIKLWKKFKAFMEFVGPIMSNLNI
ncbi:hypothetical protein J2749_002299 [Methanobacterium oryzae]